MNALIILVVIVFLLAAGAAGLKAQKKRIETGLDGMIGLEGEVIERLNPRGKVYVHGEMWEAVIFGSDAAGRGESITVESVSGNILMVRRKKKEEVK